jgi:S-adenosylmethionine:tRNA ribosyltransferase-isomerase
MRLSDFDYELPPELVAREPARARDEARLFVHARAADASSHTQVRALGEFLRAGDLLVLNDTRVLAARLFARRASGGAVELLLVEPLAGAPNVWKALAHPARRLSAGERLTLEGGAFQARLVERPLGPDGRAAPEWHVELCDDAGAVRDPLDVLARIGHVPLPPYLERADGAADEERYQTVYAARPGAVAAPTAGLHFTPELLAELEQRGVRRAFVTLHVGPGTFQPVQCEDVRAHVMHAERYELTQATVDAVLATKAAGGRVVAVGTTSVRVLESCAAASGALAPGSGSTRLFLVPGASFRVVDALLTNFHLPRSTLLMLVCAFAGTERVLRLYREAIEQRYRFYSYGDAMLFL